MIQINSYIREIFNFLRTVTIKNTYFANQILEATTKSRNVAALTDYQNPYYLHLIGEYTQEDEVMKVFSFDTGEEVVFDKHLKDNHPKTALMYKIPSKYHTALCQKYPTQIDLIKSIIYPVTSIDDAISAKNYTVLNYDVSVLQENERDTIVQSLLKTMAMIQERWDVKEFVYEECYPHTMWAAIWYYLPLLVSVQRVRNLRTAAVHPYHIWEYLTSKGLKDYRTLLTLKQQIFMYKNIVYILNNRGKTSNLNILSDALLDEHNVELRSKTILLNNGKTVSEDLPCATTPEIISEEINGVTTALQDSDNGIESVSEIFQREYIDGLEPQYFVPEIATQTRTFSTHPETYLPTKLVELKKQPVNRDTMSLFFRFMAESFLYRLTTGEINFNISVQLDVAELPIVFAPKEALALICYAISREYGVDAKYIPDTFKLSVPFTKETVTYPSTIKVRGHYDYQTATSADGKEFLTSSIINAETIKESIPELLIQLDKPSTMVEFFDGQFSVMGCHLAKLRSVGNTLYNTAFRQVYPNFLVSDVVHYSLFDLPETVISEVRVIEHTPANIHTDSIEESILITNDQLVDNWYTHEHSQKFYKLLIRIYDADDNFLGNPDYDTEVVISNIAGTPYDVTDAFGTVIKTVYSNVQLDLTRFIPYDGELKITFTYLYSDLNDYTRRLVDLIKYVENKGATSWAMTTADKSFSVVPSTPSDLLTELYSKLDTLCLMIYKNDPSNPVYTTTGTLTVTNDPDTKTIIVADPSVTTRYTVLHRHKLIDSLDEKWGEWMTSTDVVVPFTINIPRFYESWFRSNEDLDNIIKHYNSVSNPKEEYAQIAFDLIAVLFPLEYSNNATSTGLSLIQYRKMKQLFVQLCSYHIAFLDTSRLENVYLFSSLNTINNVNSTSSVIRRSLLLDEKVFDHTTFKELRFKIRDFELTTPRENFTSRISKFVPNIDPRISIESRRNTYLLVANPAKQKDGVTSAYGTHRVREIFLREEI